MYEQEFTVTVELAGLDVKKVTGQNQTDVEQRYLESCKQILSAIVPENPRRYKELVGNVFFEYNRSLIGDKATKVTVMLINMPIDDIKMIMQDWSLFKTRVNQASELLDNQPSGPANNQTEPQETPEFYIDHPEMTLKSINKFGLVSLTFNETLLTVSNLTKINSTVLEIDVQSIDEERQPLLGFTWKVIAYLGQLM